MVGPNPCLRIRWITNDHLVTQFDSHISGPDSDRIADAEVVPSHDEYLGEGRVVGIPCRYGDLRVDFADRFWVAFKSRVKAPRFNKGLIVQVHSVQTVGRRDACRRPGETADAALVRYGLKERSVAGELALWNLDYRPMLCLPGGLQRGPAKRESAAATAVGTCGVRPRTHSGIHPSNRGDVPSGGNTPGCIRTWIE